LLLIYKFEVADFRDLTEQNYLQQRKLGFTLYFVTVSPLNMTPHEKMAAKHAKDRTNTN
jgi:hypothetical protein